MAGRKALISKDDLDRMATAVAAHNVVMQGRVDSLGNFTFTLSPKSDAVAPSNDDLDDRIERGEGF